MRDENGNPTQPRCIKCGADAHFGFGVRLMKDTPGRWYCRDHKHLGDIEVPEVKARKGGDQEKRRNDKGTLL